MDLNARYPAVRDLKARAKSRIPKFVWEYLDSGTGEEHTKARNRSALDALRMMPSVLHGEFEPDLSVEFLGNSFPLPFGIAPVGMSGLMWPQAEKSLATAADRHGIPYSLSAVAAASAEDVGPCLGDHGWFQLYPPRDTEIRKDVIARARQVNKDVSLSLVKGNPAIRLYRRLGFRQSSRDKTKIHKRLRIT